MQPLKSEALINLRRSATEAQLVLDSEHELEFGFQYEFELGFGLKCKFELGFDFGFEEFGFEFQGEFYFEFESEVACALGSQNLTFGPKNSSRNLLGRAP